MKAKEYDRDTVPGDYATLSTPCPNCGGVVQENYRRYNCGASNGTDACGFSFTKIPAGRAFELHEVEQFLRDKRIGPLQGFRSKAGWPFTAELALKFSEEDKNWKLEFDFGERPTRPRPARSSTSRAGAVGPVSEVRRPRVRVGQQLRLREVGADPGATHPHLRLQDRPDHPAAAGGARADGTSCWPPARPTCSTSSCPCARGAPSRPSWPGMPKPAR
jgi:hypothetical protein